VISFFSFSFSVSFFMFCQQRVGKTRMHFLFSIVNQKEEEYHIASGKREERGRREKGTNVYFFVFVFGIPICTLKREKWDVHIYLYQSTAFWYKADDCQMHKKSI
jgi:hypothetical protein